MFEEAFEKLRSLVPLAGTFLAAVAGHVCAGLILERLKKPARK